MRDAANHSQLAEVLVQGHQNSLLSAGPAEDFLVSRVFRQVANPLHVVPLGLQSGPCSAPDAGVEQNLHAVVSASIGSTRSCSTKRCA